MGPALLRAEKLRDCNHSRVLSSTALPLTGDGSVDAVEAGNRWLQRPASLTTRLRSPAQALSSLILAVPSRWKAQPVGANVLGSISGLTGTQGLDKIPSDGEQPQANRDKTENAMSSWRSLIFSAALRSLKSSSIDTSCRGLWSELAGLPKHPMRCKAVPQPRSPSWPVPYAVTLLVPQYGSQTKHSRPLENRWDHVLPGGVAQKPAADEFHRAGRWGY